MSKDLYEICETCNGIVKGDRIALFGGREVVDDVIAEFRAGRQKITQYLTRDHEGFHPAYADFRRSRSGLSVSTTKETENEDAH